MFTWQLRFQGHMSAQVRSRHRGEEVVQNLLIGGNPKPRTSKFNERNQLRFRTPNPDRKKNQVLLWSRVERKLNGKWVTCSGDEKGDMETALSGRVEFT
jgi:hypothetical protein